MFDDQKQYLQRYHIVSDMICIAVLYFVLIPFFISFKFNTSLYFKLFPIVICIPLLLPLIKKYIKTKSSQTGIMCLQTFITSSVFAGFLFCISSIVNPDLLLNIIFSTVSGAVLWIILLLNRFHIAYLIKHSSSNQNLTKHILIIGTAENAESLSKYLNSHPETGLRVVGFLTEKSDEIGKIINNKPVLGKIQDILAIIHDNYTDCVLYTDAPEYEQYYGLLFTTCSIRGIDFATTKTVYRVDANSDMQISQENINNLPIEVFKSVYCNPKHIFLKRVFDFIVSIILIGITSPLWIIIAVSIKMTSPGPILFGQERIGKYGKKFILYKFRSMVENAENLQAELEHLNEMDGPAFKIQNDPRQTSTGRFLRKTSLDELPQLLNVFKGDISLVGPRPALEKEVLKYHPWERKRLSVAQGITCIWQISGRNTIKFDEWMKLDVMYIENRSLAVDFQILLKTIPAVLFKKGAY